MVVRSKSLSSNLCLDFNTQGIVISKKFSKYDCMQVLIDDSRWLKAEFRDQPSVYCNVHRSQSSELAQVMPSGLECNGIEISWQGLSAVQ